MNWTILMALQVLMLDIKFGWNWFSGSWEEVENVNYGFWPVSRAPREGGPWMPQFWWPLRYLCYISNLVGIGSAVLEKNSKMWIMVFGPPPGPLGKGAHELNNFDGPSGTYTRNQIWLELVQRFLRRSRKFTHDNRRSMIAIGHLKYFRWPKN